MRIWWVSLLAVLLGCQVEKLQPEKVAMGLGRLTVRNAALLTDFISRDDRCGFKSARVLGRPLVQGQQGQPGAVTWTVEDCTLDFGELNEQGSDCQGNKTLAAGRAVVSATRRVRGTLTGDLNNPVVPDSADSVHMSLDVVLEHFIVRSSASTGALTNESGSIHFEAEPHLALSRTQGVCSVPTRDLKLSNIRYQNAAVVIDSGDRVFPVTVPSSDFSAQVGKWKDKENSIEGQLTVWETAVTLPIASDQSGLDPDYAPAAHLAAFSCNEDLALPVTYTCPSLNTQLAQGAARLTVGLFGGLASLTDADGRCGFSSPSTLATARLTGVTGGQGKAVFTLSAGGCILDFPMRQARSTDCNGKTGYVQGRAVVKGTKTISGVLTGNPSGPVIPTSRDAAEFALEAVFTDFTLSDSTNGATLTAASGSLSGAVLPRLAINTQTALCSLQTNVAEFRNLAWKDASLRMNVGAASFQVDASSSNLDAQSGNKGDRTNYLSGVIISDGQPVALPSAGALPLLEPQYTQAAFESAFLCGTMALAQSDAECAFDNVLAVNTARLLVQNVGAVATLINRSTQCGFEDFGVKTNPYRVEGTTGGPGLLAWKVSGCRVGQMDPSLLSQDCQASRKYTSGYAMVDAERVVTGERDTRLAIFESVIPRTPDAVTITLADTMVTDFSAYTLSAGSTAPSARLILHSGRLSAKVVPILGERISKPAVYDVPTPVATLAMVHLVNASGTLEVGGLRFPVTVTDALIDAQSGSLRGRSNVISGRVQLPSSTVTLPSGTALDPSFQQAAFDASYACTPDLKATVPPN